MNAVFGVTYAVLPAFPDLRGGPELFGLVIGGIGLGVTVGMLVAPRF